MKTILLIALLLAGCAKSGMTEQQLREMFPRKKHVVYGSAVVQPPIKAPEKTEEKSNISIESDGQCSIVISEATDDDPQDKSTIKELAERYKKLNRDFWIQQQRLDSANEDYSNAMNDWNRINEENKELKSQIQKLLVDRSR